MVKFGVDHDVFLCYDRAAMIAPAIAKQAAKVCRASNKVGIGLSPVVFDAYSIARIKCASRKKYGLRKIYFRVILQSS